MNENTLFHPMTEESDALSTTQDVYIKQLAEWIQESTSTVVLTGAGMSTESGVPDFRSSKGLWKTHEPRQLASEEALYHRYEDFHVFYSHRIEGLSICLPNLGHRVLAEWEEKGRIEAVITQNVDRFHQMAGSKHVLELHGNIRTVRCHECKREAEMQSFLNGEVCIHCGGRLRPNVVLFGEDMPASVWRQSVEATQKAELLVVIGTRLEVSPANYLPQMLKGKVVLINKDKTASDDDFDLVIHDLAGNVLQMANQLLGK